MDFTLYYWRLELKVYGHPNSYHELGTVITVVCSVPVFVHRAQSGVSPLKKSVRLRSARRALTIIAVFPGWAMHDFPNWRKSGTTSIAVSVKRCALYLQRPSILILTWMRRDVKFADHLYAKMSVWAVDSVKRCVLFWGLQLL